MHPSSLAYAVLSLVLLSGCLVGERSSEPDVDFDYLVDAIELSGWNVTVLREPADCDLPLTQPRSELTYHVTSDELEPDTDGDGVQDSDEFLFRSDPRSNDTDGDGLSDRLELDWIQNRTFEFASNLRLWDVDSDGDCLTDPAEVHGVAIQGLGTRTTDPTVADTDQDGWTDGREAYRTLTDPTRDDTDGDGAIDRFDVHPRRNIGIDLTFMRLRVAPSSDRPAGSSFNVSFIYGLLGPGNEPIAPPQPPPEFVVRVGADAAVGAEHSPGLRDINDESAEPEVRLQFWIQAPDGDFFLALDDAEEDPIVTLYVNPTTNKWRTASGSHAGPTEGSAVLESQEARLEFTVRAVTV